MTKSLDALVGAKIHRAEYGFQAEAHDDYFEIEVDGGKVFARHLQRSCSYRALCHYQRRGAGSQAGVSWSVAKRGGATRRVTVRSLHQTPNLGVDQ